MKSCYKLGLIFIFFVTIIWSLSSILAQYIYLRLSFDSPFLLTYVSTSLFIIFIPSIILWERHDKILLFVRTILAPKICSKISLNNHQYSIQRDEDSTKRIIPWTHQNQTCTIENKENVNDFKENNGNEAESLNETDILSHLQHLSMAIYISPLWFVSNYCYNVSLLYTSITSSTVLSSTGSVFAFLFAVLFGKEKFTWNKAIGIILVVLGCYFTSVVDTIADSSSNSEKLPPILEYYPNRIKFWSEMTNNHHAVRIWGDISGLFSTIGYGLYTVMIKYLCPMDERCMSMGLFLGYVGMINSLVLLPLAIWIVVKYQSNISTNEMIPYYNLETNGTDPFRSFDLQDKSTTQEGLTRKILVFLFVKGTLDNVISDYLWARSVILTSATVATVGLGLTIPLALLSDLFIIGRDEMLNNWGVIGASLVLVGFLLVNLADNTKKN